MKVYVADDYDNFRTLLAGMLRRDGHEVVEARDGRTLLALATSSAPDVIVTDLRLPALSGLGVLEGLRAHGVAVPAIVTTGCSPEDIQPDADRLGAVVLQKPFTAEELRAAFAEAGARP